MAGAIDAAAADASITRGSRAATFARPSGAATSLIAYGEPTGCSAAGIACFDRSGAPNSFRMWFRAHGHVYDWGALLWCQGLATIANGCFDAEMVALDEFGHVENLGHHVNDPSGSDYLDAAVQAISHARSDLGWQVHAFGPCDTARLQLQYDRVAARDLFSTCLDVATSTSLAASATGIWVGDTMRFTALLRTTAVATNGALANDPVGSRPVTLQRRTVGTLPWTSMGTMVASLSPEGTYTLSMSPTATYEWRALFVPSAADGATGSASAALRVTVTGCSGTGCPGGGIQ
jgi:hypothetical protein